MSTTQGSEVYISETIIQNRDIHVFIDEIIEGEHYLRNLHKVLNEASENDTVTFHMSSPGGCVYTALTASRWIQGTPATTVAILEGANASAAGYIILACDAVVVHPHSFLMCHAMVHGYSGFQDHVRGYVEFAGRHLNDIVRDVYEGFLTEDEIDSIITSSKELWLDSEQILERLDKRQELLQEQQEGDNEHS